jgi:hypothetical protein
MEEKFYGSASTHKRGTTKGNTARFRESEDTTTTQEGTEETTAAASGKRSR